MSQVTENSIKNLRSKIESIRFCMMTTISDELNFSSRPMTQQHLDDNGTLWFFTSDNCPLADDLLHHPKIGVTFSNPSDSVYIAMSGDGELIKSREKAEEFWNPLNAAWFPEGLDDPHLSLIKFNIHYAEYWDSDTNKMMKLFAMAKAALLGQQPTGIGEHEKIEF